MDNVNEGSSQHSGREPQDNNGVKEIDPIDMEDLFSDESDNDDLVDNEEELALLLKSQNLSIEELLPSKGSVVSAQDQSLPARNQEQEQQPQQQQQQPESQQQQQQHQTESQQQHDAPELSEAIDNAPPPVILTPEENAELTSIIRDQATKSLEVNRLYQKAILQQLEEVKKAYERNAKLRARYSAAVEKYKTVEDAPVILESTNTRLGPPYFVDQNNNVPPDNNDAILRKKRPLVVTNKAKSWTKEERDNLKAGVISENKRLLFEMFTEEGDIAGIRSLDSAPDLQMMLNTKGIDWSRISQRFVDTRSASECLIRWTGHDHPGINKGEWSREEIERLDKLAKKYNERNWIQIALDLDTNRTGADCFRKYQSRKTKAVQKVHWTPEEDAILTEAVRLLGENNWTQVSYYLENRSAGQCQHHWTKRINPVIRRGRWLEEEDGALRTAIDVYGQSRWVKIQAHILGRTDVQCRERYMNILAPNIKTGPWTTEECEKLDELVRIHGEKKWSFIASLIEGRTDNQCARRYRTMCIERARADAKKNPGEPRAYLSLKRRRGRTTISRIPDPERHKSAIRKAAADIRIRERFEDALRRKREVEKARIVVEQKKAMQLEHDIFIGKQGDIYDLWEERWGKYVDPIERVFNLGIPPLSKLQYSHSGEKPPAFDANLPNPASILRPGKVRPVPPCLATAETFSRLLNQGKYSNGRFKLKHNIEDGEIVIKPPTCTLLSAEEQQQPEYKELMERFEAVFMWPMMMGMLDMTTAKQILGKRMRETRQINEEDDDDDDDDELDELDDDEDELDELDSDEDDSDELDELDDDEDELDELDDDDDVEPPQKRRQTDIASSSNKILRPQQPLPRPRRKYTKRK